MTFSETDFPKFLVSTLLYFTLLSTPQSQ